MTDLVSDLVIGIGNRYRRDDGVGPAVLDALGERLPPDRLVEADGEPARLLDLWESADRVVVVDAVRTGAPPGTCWSFAVRDEHDLPVSPSTSSHAHGLGEAWRLGRALDRLPARLVVVAVEAADLGEGPGLTPDVAAAVPVATARVLEHLGAPSCA